MFTCSDLGNPSRFHREGFKIGNLEKKYVVILIAKFLLMAIISIEFVNYLIIASLPYTIRAISVRYGLKGGKLVQRIDPPIQHRFPRGFRKCTLITRAIASWTWYIMSGKAVSTREALIQSLKRSLSHLHFRRWEQLWGATSETGPIIGPVFFMHEWHHKMPLKGGDKYKNKNPGNDHHSRGSIILADRH